MITKVVSYCFTFDRPNGLGKVYIVPKRFKCSFARPSRNRNNIIWGYVNLKNNMEEFQRSEVYVSGWNPSTLKRITKKRWNYPKFKRKAKWHKYCALELSSSK